MKFSLSGERRTLCGPKLGSRQFSQLTRLHLSTGHDSRRWLCQRNRLFRIPGINWLIFTVCVSSASFSGFRLDSLARSLFGTFYFPGSINLPPLHRLCGSCDAGGKRQRKAKNSSETRANQGVIDSKRFQDCGLCI
jgi:hypothetical protein